MNVVPSILTWMTCATSIAHVMMVVLLNGLNLSRVTPQSCRRSAIDMNWKPKAYITRRGCVVITSEGEWLAATRKTLAFSRYQLAWLIKKGNL